MAGRADARVPPRNEHEPVRVRRARIEEIRALAREYGQEAANLSWRRRPSPDAIPEGGIFWIAEDGAGEGTLGYAAGSLRPDGLTVGPVYVRPQARRRGVGQELLQAIQSWAEETGIPVVEVSVAAGDEAGRSFLESVGYVPRRILFSYASSRKRAERASPTIWSGDITRWREPDAKARRAWRIAGWGTLFAGGGLAAVSAASGLGGRTGLRFFLLGALLACALGALYALASGALDAVRGRQIGRDRVVAAVVLSALAILLPTMVIGLAG